MGTLLNAPECLPTLLDAGMSNFSICIPVMFPLVFPIMTWADRYTRPQRVDAGEVSNTKHKISIGITQTIHDTVLIPCVYQPQQSSTRLGQQPEKALVSLLFEISSAEQDSCATGR